MLPEENNKIDLGAQHLLNPRPVILVGTYIDDKPNFITVAWTGITSAEPPTMSVAIRNIRYSLKGILNNKTFSVNIPSSAMVQETDFCGCESGEDYNKVYECGFDIFYGELTAAPLIRQCPVNIECKVERNIIIGDHTLVIGEIIGTYISGHCLTDGIPDIRKIDPLCFCTLTKESMGYYKVGDYVSGTTSSVKKTE